ncbi:hypothetical protein [Azospirillum sp.]|uniref:lipopolysaccharide biosynthesis protein n=1 Tax=Azospirillum sp. TaxID=34012 RepID=UPI002D31ED1E|nr:hypothetical protein [Azospirillum sp.]HYD69845.1 hypothetical protein [Azospirillum sp.]
MTVRGFLAARPDTLLAHLIATGVGEFVYRITQLLTVALAGWVLGAADLGVIGIAWSLTAIAAGIVQAGSEHAGTHRLAVSPPDQGARILTDVSALKLGLILAAVPVLFGVQTVLGYVDAGSRLQLAAQVCSMALVSLGYGWALNGLGRFYEQGLIRLFQGLATLVLLVLLLLVFRSPLAVPVAEGAAAMLAIVVARRRLGPFARLSLPSLTAVRELARPAIPLGFAATVGTVIWQAPILSAARWTPIEEVSHLSVLFRLMLGLHPFLNVALQTIYPSLARTMASDPHRGREMVFVLTLHASVAMTAVVVVLAGMSEILVPTILGPHFPQAAPLFRLLVPVMVPFTIAAALTSALVARGQARTIVCVTTATAAMAAVASNGAFWLWPTATGALVFHGVLWGQAAMTGIAAWRCGVIGRPAAAWNVWLNPLTLGRMVHLERAGTMSGASLHPAK